MIACLFSKYTFTALFLYLQMFYKFESLYL